MMATAICWLIIISSAMLVLGKNCTNIREYHHKDFGCQPCPACMKGTGINLTQKIEYSNLGMLSCYSCESCPEGTYQDEFALKSCKQCRTCPNRQLSRNCSNTENIICGDCLPGYFVQTNKEIIVCDTKSSGNSAEIIPWILFGISLLIIFVLAYFLYKKAKSENLNDEESSTVPVKCSNKKRVSNVPTVIRRVAEAFKAKSENTNDEESSTGDSRHDSARTLLEDKSDYPNDKESSTVQIKCLNKAPISKVPVECSNEESLLYGESRHDSARTLLEAKSENPNDEESSTVPVESSNKESLLNVNPELYEPVDDKTIALKIGKDWKSLARLLDFMQADIDEIKHDEWSLRDQAFNFINKFRQRGGSNNKLTKALIELNLIQLLKQK